MKLAINFFLLFMTSNLYSIALPNNAKVEPLTDFSGGLNTVTPSHKLPTNQSPYMRNVFVDGENLEAPGGMAVLGSTNTLIRITGIFPFIRENGQTTLLVTDSSVTLETSDFITYTFVSSGSNTGSLLNWKQSRNKMWGYNGVDFPITWDGTTKSIMDGTKGFPNVPKFKYMIYDQDRVWGMSIPNFASDVYFTSVITTDNVIIAPDDFRAWPSINNFSVGRGDGQIITSAWVFQGQIRVGKERSIYTIFGNTPSSYKPSKEETSIGVVSNDSVVVMDGETHYLGEDGIYRNVQRISDLIETDVESINKGVTNVLTNSWETQSEFLKGQLSGTTITASGFVTVSTIPFTISGSVVGIPEGTQTLGASSTFYGPLEFDFISNVSNDQIVYTRSLTVPTFNSAGGIQCVIDAHIYNPFTGVTHSASALTDPNDFLTINFSSQSPSFSGSQINNSGYILTFNYLSGPGGFTCGVTPPVSFTFLPSTTGQYISDVATNVTVTAWGNYDSVRNTNGGNISYYYRSSTSVVNITTQTWQAITPGAIIGAPTQNRFIQWASTIQVLAELAPAIDNVSISHIEGQSSYARAFAMDWKNRYWLAVTTTTNSSLKLIYVKSKTSNSNPNAWMPVEGMNVACFAKVGNTFYGGSSSTGTVFRLDYGTNFNGTAIHSIYDTPDMVLGDNYIDKDLYLILVDGQKSIGGTLNLQYSLNQRAFNSKSFSIDGVGRYSHLVTGVRDNGNFKTLRIRLENSELDTDFQVNNMAVIYTPTSALTEK